LFASLTRSSFFSQALRVFAAHVKLCRLTNTLVKQRATTGGGPNGFPNISGSLHLFENTRAVRSHSFNVSCDQAFFIGFGVVGGMVFYQQSSVMTGLQWGMNCLGAVFMLIGFVLLIYNGG
jgi:hypothetical protein